MSSQKLGVLIVDDDFYVAHLHRQYVESVRGFVITKTVGSLAAAREAIVAQKPDLVLLDVYLPDGNGLDFAREIETDVFILSAASEQSSVKRAMRYGALCYLVKPFTAESLRERLTGYIRYRNILSSAESLTQETIARAQRVFHAVTAGGDATQSATELSIREVINTSLEELSAVDVASAVGVSRATAQRYLTALATSGHIRMRLRYGSAGRPEHRYSSLSS
ncbi:response regulator [Lysinibacter sp. HNR]|uniref:response regulator n=1 Tax=Lysinibacter sp. HNR TaxID=3031408 RepID=UPI00243546A6|nr:response regulator [Lysinibacter sp. HNR]WGD38327.1 response regulator [Lysinibacter sp. HNR]